MIFRSSPTKKYHIVPFADPMHAPHKIFYFSGVVICLTAAAAYPAGKPRSTSTSRQFIVYGTEVRMRGAMCDLAERTKANLLHLLDLRDNWKTPLLINLDYPQANFPDAPAAQLDVSQLGFGLKLQLNLLVSGEMRRREVQRQLLRVILIEVMYRDRGNIAAGTPYVAPPDWLVDGVLELQPGHDSNDNAKLLQTMVTAKKIMPLDDLVRERRALLDAPSRQLHAYAMALLQLLLDASGGRRKLAQFIADLPVAPNDALADLRVHFPETLGRSPAKWWALSVAGLSASDRHETLSATETAGRLDRLLRFSILAPDGTSQDYSLGDYKAFRKLPAHRVVLGRISQQLLLLGALAHPSYRAIVQEDCELAELIARGKLGKVGARLKRVANYRQVVERQQNEVDDYLNWYEATQTRNLSDTFSELIETDRAAHDAQARRRDPISVYLDSIEMETN
jgi:hypothetical protein